MTRPISDSTSTTATTTAAGLCQDLVVPAYFDPYAGTRGGNLWNTMLASVPALKTIIANPNDGPGAASDPSYVKAIQMARSKGLRVAGYVHTHYGAADAVKKAGQDIEAWASFYGVMDIFLDTMPTDVSFIPLYLSHSKHIKTRGGLTILNPGTVFPEAWVAQNVGDVFVSFEDGAKAYSSASFPSWMTSGKYPPARFMHLIYGVGEGDLATVLARTRTLRVGHVYITGDDLPNPWDSLASYWPALVASINKGCGR